ncbi:MAG: hypothetical protein ABWK04_00425 [Hydrogenobacter sp.]
MKKWLIALLLLLLSVEGSISLTHRHEDGKQHLDCSVCILQHSLVDKPSYKPELKVSLVSFTIEISYEPQEPILRPSFRTTLQRAPPKV